GKFDYTINDANRFTLTGNGNNEDISGLIGSPVAGTPELPRAAGTSSGNGYALIGRETALFGSRTFLESTLGYTSADNGTNLDRTTRSEPLLLLLRSPGFLRNGDPFRGKVQRDPPRLQLNENLSHMTAGWHGDHQLKAGFDLNHVALTGSNEGTKHVQDSGGCACPHPT